MVLGEGTVLNSSSLLAGFVRSGTGWGIELSLQGQ